MPYDDKPKSEKQLLYEYKVMTSNPTKKSHKID